MSSEVSTNWTTLTVSEDTSELVNQFSDAYGITSNDKTVALLANIVANSDYSPEDVPESLSPGFLKDFNDSISINGVLVTDPDGNMKYVGVNGTVDAVLTDTTTPESRVQPLPRTNITSGDIVCPACGDVLMSYSLSDSIPGIETGVFNEFSIPCSSCDSHRPYYTLFVSAKDSPPRSTALGNVMQSYYAYVLLLESYSPGAFMDRVSACKQLAIDGGWDWLPTPDNWVGFDIGIENYSAVTEEMYMDFITQYLSQSLAGVDGVSVVGAEPVSTPLNDGTGGNTWEVQVETRGENVESIVSSFMGEFECWDNQSVEKRIEEPDTLADKRVILRFPRFLVDAE